MDCPTPDDKSPASGHNFVIWPDVRHTGSGIVVFNTRRAAKMVVLDLDHPDIEDFINWKVVEEEKVASIVTGSRLLNRHLNLILKAITRWSKPEEKFDPIKNEDLHKAIADARAVLVPTNYIERVIQLGKQGFTSLQFEEYNTDWNSKAYFTVSGQNSNNSVRIDNAFMDAVHTDGPIGICTGARTQQGGEGTSAAQAAKRSMPGDCGTRSPMQPGPVPIPACNSTPRSMNGIRVRWMDASTRRIRALQVRRWSRRRVGWSGSTSCWTNHFRFLVPMARFTQSRRHFKQVSSRFIGFARKPATKSS